MLAERWSGQGWDGVSSQVAIVGPQLVPLKSIRTEDGNWERRSPVKLGRSVGPVPAPAFCDYDHRDSLSAVPEVVRATFEESKLQALLPHLS